MWQEPHLDAPILGRPARPKMKTALGTMLSMTMIMLAKVHCLTYPMFFRIDS